MDIFSVDIVGTHAKLTAYLHPDLGPLKDVVWQPEKRPAILVVPGGSYYYCSPKEGYPIALAYLNKGFNVFVLEYSVGQQALYPRVLEEISLAVWTIRKNADQWRIFEDQIALVGFSAGGNLVGMLGNHWSDSELLERLNIPEGGNQPNAQILSYALLGYKGMEAGLRMIDAVLQRLGVESVFDIPYDVWNSQFPSPVGAILLQRPQQVDVYSEVNENTPPTFVWHTLQDEVVNPIQPLMMVQALIEHQIPCEFHLFEEGGHGLSTATPLSDVNRETVWSVSHWLDLSVDWLKRQFIA